MVIQIFIYPQGVQCGGIETVQKHIDDNQQIDFTVFHVN